MSAPIQAVNVLRQAAKCGAVQGFDVMHGDQGDCALGHLHLHCHGGDREATLHCWDANARMNKPVMEELRQLFWGNDAAYRRLRQCPRCGLGGYGNLCALIMHLNDTHQLKLAEIADLLETLA